MIEKIPTSSRCGTRDCLISRTVLNLLNYRTFATGLIKKVFIYSLLVLRSSASDTLIWKNPLDVIQCVRSSYCSDMYVQSTLVISTSVISNNRLSRRENLVLVLTQKSKIRLQNIVEKRRNCSWGAISPLFHNIFYIYF